MAKSRSPYSQIQGQQYQLNQRKKTIKRGEDQTEERDQRKRETETNTNTDQTKEKKHRKLKDRKKAERKR